jgi:spore maturation protein CgeB
MGLVSTDEGNPNSGLSRMKLMKSRFPRKVLIAGPSGQDSFADNIAVTLQAMGVEVVLENPARTRYYHSRLSAIANEFLYKARRHHIRLDEHWLIEAAKKNRPELFLAPTQIIAEETLWAMKRAGVRACVAWWGDSPANMQRMGLLTDQWDLIFIKDRDCVQKFRRIGLNAYLLHEAMNPLWHKPMAQQANEDVVVAGNFYEYRQVLVRRLLAKGVSVQLYGGRLPRWVHPEIKRLHTGRYIVREEKSKVFGEGLACLNSTQIIEGNSLNCRAFEIAGAGGLHLMEYRPIISDCFEPGKEVLTFDSLDELFAHIERAKRFPNEMKLIREAAVKRALAEHTYRHRLERIFAMASEL